MSEKPNSEQFKASALGLAQMLLATAEDHKDLPRDSWMTDLRGIVRRLEAADSAAPSRPIPMRIACEACGKLHIDEGEFATKPHHTHSCQHCGLTWRPAVFHTVGVQFLPGFKNEAKP